MEHSTIGFSNLSSHKSSHLAAINIPSECRLGFLYMKITRVVVVGIIRFRRDCFYIIGQLRGASEFIMLIFLCGA